jgi:molybdopterin/thiamine biosynthesis adenylyltransferase
MTVNPTRHLTLFSPREFGDKRIDVVGAGATGSHVAMMLAKLGVQNLHVWDADTIEDHNIANQIYNNDQVGQPKVSALADLIKTATGTEITQHNEFLVKGQKDLGEVVFVLVDSMSGRKEIIEGCLMLNMRTRLAIETRMGAENGTIHCFNPMSMADVKGWLLTYFPDEEAETDTACGASTTVMSTAAIISGIAVQHFMRWAKTGVIDEKIIDIMLRPSLITSAENFEPAKQAQSA